MAFQLTALYNQPADPQAFDAHYDQVHTPLGQKLPGLRSFSVSRPGPGPDGTPPPFHLVAVLTFDSEQALTDSLGSPDGQAAVADLDNFAQAGVTLLTGPVNTVT